MYQMKKIITLLLLANLLISGACNFSTGSKKDFRTGFMAAPIIWHTIKKMPGDI